MKFAKELERELVPEWRAKYFDYKQGKKKVKSVERALRSVTRTPKTPGRQIPSNLLANAFLSPIRNQDAFRDDSVESTPDHRVSGITSYGSTKPTLKENSRPASVKQNTQNSPRSRAQENIPEEQDEAAPLPIPRPSTKLGTSQDSTTAWESGAITTYGSFAPTPAQRNVLMGPPPALELPDPALPTEEESFARHNRAWRQSRFNPNPNTTPPSQQLEGASTDAYTIGKNNAPTRHESSHILPKGNPFRSRRAVSTSGVTPNARPRSISWLFSPSGPDSLRNKDVPLEVYKELDTRQAEFFEFLDKELAKIESFYKMKEAQASARLKLLRDQLHEMRDRRIHEIGIEQLAKQEAARVHQRQGSRDNAHGQRHNSTDSKLSTAARWMKPIEGVLGLGPARIGKTSKFLQEHTSPPGPAAQHQGGSQRPEAWGDFTRRPSSFDEVPYRSAKRKLKLALQEFYRGLELLKSYALMNRTAFRKINKKYDKAVKARPTQRYMSEKVSKAWFVQSEVLEGQIVAVEDLYARYFERGNHKVAVGKLRSKSQQASDYSGSVFRNGVMLAAGAVFGIQGLVYGADHLSSSSSPIRTGTSFLLQVYAGYFLALFLFLLFCLDCQVWTRAKINYPFIFEFDSRHNLDWHQLSELPCFFFLLLGIFIWLNFQQDATNSMFLYWPVVLIGLTVIVMFLPVPWLYHQSREWWAYSNFRLFFAGLYPVEFRDFFLGDMYCSLTYSVGNLELFFCLYSHSWNEPNQCNSSHSRLFGFFTTVPGIWRAFQCLRRYYDTRNAFPHLANCTKYSFTILFYMTLSLYRIDDSESLKALFITCATINAVYCSVWDLAMDWSLCNYYADHVFLRNVLGYKRPWVYYLAMILNPILRFNWIFYALYTHDNQHSAVLSFFVAFSEVCRRAMWSLFRVENEHCTNVGRFRASRDVPLPYDIKLPPSPASHSRDQPLHLDGQAPTLAAGPTGVIYQSAHPGLADFAPAESSAAEASALTSSRLEAQPSMASLRRRFTPANTPVTRGIARVGTIMTEAHAQDFERKRRPRDVGLSRTRSLGAASAHSVAFERSPHHGGRTVGLESSDEEDDEDEVAIQSEEEEIDDREDVAAARAANQAAGGTGISERDMAVPDATATAQEEGSMRRRRRSDVF